MNSPKLIWCNVKNAAYTITNTQFLSHVEVVFLSPVFNTSKPKMQFSKDFFRKIVGAKSLVEISSNDALIKERNIALAKRKSIA